MTVYATKADIESVWGAEIFADILPDGVDVDAPVLEALKLASQEIDIHLSSRYRLPLPTSPAVLVGPCTAIAIYILANRHTSLTKTMEDRYKQAVEMMQRIADGKAGLGVDEPRVETGPDGSDSGAAYFGEDRVFTRRTP